MLSVPFTRIALFVLTFGFVLTSEVCTAGGPGPLLESGQAVDWWFAFKFNVGSFPNCAGAASRTCPFGGSVQNYPHGFSQQFVFASSANHNLRKSDACIGSATTDPVGATFDQVYNGSYNYVIWNDQFHGDPHLQCEQHNFCDKPWAHSKGMLAWDENGEGFVMQVTTPDWPGSGNINFQRQTDGNTLGCIAQDDNIKVSQHFFSLKLTKDDVVKVLAALQNSSAVTANTNNSQIVNNGGPNDIRAMVQQLGVLSTSTSATKDTLSSGVQIISKPSALNVPPWQMVSALLGGVDLNVATWYERDKIPDTDGQTPIGCWDPALGQPGAVKNMHVGHWEDVQFGLVGGNSPEGNHAKIGVSATGDFAIFGDMNQEGFLSGPVCNDRQNARGGLFFVIQDGKLAGDLRQLMSPQ